MDLFVNFSFSLDWAQSLCPSGMWTYANTIAKEIILDIEEEKGREVVWSWQAGRFNVLDYQCVAVHRWIWIWLDKKRLAWWRCVSSLLTFSFSLTSRNRDFYAFRKRIYPRTVLILLILLNYYTLYEHFQLISQRI